MAGDRKFLPARAASGLRQDPSSHRHGIIGFPADMNAGRDPVVLQPQELKKASGATKTRVNFEINAIATKDLVRNKRNTRQRQTLPRGDCVVVIVGSVV